MDELVEQITRDRIFYDDSGGGVTFSGGEPLAQPEFLLGCLEACRRLEIHTAVDTCGFAPRETLLQAAQLTDLFLFDLKLLDDRRHRELIGVSKRYDKIEALRKVSFSVKSGEFLTIVGPNGSGKTTLLKILAFLERPTEGVVYFDGVKVDDGNETGFRRRSTMVFQKTVLLRGSVRDNIAYGLEQRGHPRREIEVGSVGLWRSWA